MKRKIIFRSKPVKKLPTDKKRPTDFDFVVIRWPLFIRGRNRFVACIIKIYVVLRYKTTS